MTSPLPYFDGHNDFLLRLMTSSEPRETLWLGDSGSGHLDLNRMKQAGFKGGFFAMFVPPIQTGAPVDFMALMQHPPYDLPLPPLMTHGQAQGTALTMAGLMQWMERSAPDDFALCRTPAQIRAALDSDRIVGILHMEGAEAIGPNLDAVYLFHDMGLRSIGPVWSRPTIFGHGVPMRYPGDPDVGPGLSEKGKDLVRLCDELGIMIDLSHLNAAGVDDVARISTKPLVATHSNVHAICASARNLTDRQLGQIRDSGGMVGLNFATFFLAEDGVSDVNMGFDPMLRHIDYLLEKLGEDHVGLGSDFDGAVIPAAVGDVTGVPSLLQAMSDHGYGPELVAKVACDNWLALLDRTLA
ncbi:dipeptidase [Marinibacterium profundimaris]|uniref:Peptidase n=1 Tax=Marinibacterium profundimaris TaxID=1679460 RepID=A0A225NHK2_9RHOB|nr:dipeptidase [Marinibacterium profundimaris]OWU69853.1 peptidase [Marinibacterium profundimaris]